MSSLREIFEKKKDEYKLIYFCTKKHEIFLVKGCYTLMPQKTVWVTYADNKLFGKDKLVKQCSTWIKIGRI